MPAVAYSVCCYVFLFKNSTYIALISYLCNVTVVTVELFWSCYLTVNSVLTAAIYSQITQISDEGMLDCQVENSNVA